MEELLKNENFIKRCIEVHDGKYGYSKVNYKNNTTKVTITCPEHGDFNQSPKSHLRGHGCRKCAIKNQGVSKSNNTLKKKMEGIIQPKEYKLIPLTQGKFAKVDNEDFDRVKNINWRYSNGYARSGKSTFMHRFILGVTGDIKIDHIFHDTIDNRKSQLRIASTLENNRNQKIRKGYSSKYKGVSWKKSRNKWVSNIKKK